MNEVGQVCVCECVSIYTHYRDFLDTRIGLTPAKSPSNHITETNPVVVFARSLISCSNPGFISRLYNILSVREVVVVPPNRFCSSLL